VLGLAQRGALARGIDQHEVVVEHGSGCE
jgi:hypothetical protein